MTDIDLSEDAEIREKVEFEFGARSVIVSRHRRQH